MSDSAPIPRNEVLEGNAIDELRKLPDASVDCVVTSPPYWGLRDYEVDGQLGLEEHVDEYIDALLAIGEELQRVVKPTGGWHLNLGDTYNTRSIVRADASGLDMQRGDEEYEEYHTKEGREASGRTRRSPIDVAPKKSKLFVPHRVAINLTEQGWIAKNDIPWVKPPGGKDSATDRYRNRHEYFFYFVLSDDNYFEATQQPHDVIEERPADDGTHNAQYPPRLVEPAIRHTCPEDGLVLDPFCGSGTTCVAAKRLGRDYLGIELKPEYARQARERVANAGSQQLTRWIDR